MENLTDRAKSLLETLPLEIWTEGPDGQMLLDLARDGHCKHTRINSTVGRFERIPPSFAERLREALRDEVPDTDHFNQIWEALDVAGFKIVDKVQRDYGAAV